ncbi:hypothetical protein HNR60_001766 [Rhodopseudomonas rhenobacensis]|uniref:Glycosyltransferase RgtA/B/C/D-like domain-containing protein n=1 Tax=Rhodopseudomonas rhenobacensis TaxID=87461 RepID=A0A7W8DY85_9BRAD|nr:hypothetical protein [Rhodopseudomonas rhenobacensis]MBB5047014.1 hypothetical protein [Rhodopseudomonas rhenobacensis]
MTVEDVKYPGRVPTDLLTRLLWLAALALIIFGVKLLFIRHFGTAMPYWDQWDAEADLIYKPYFNSNLSLSTLFSSHNEHRILISRIFALALFELDGGWDPILQMMANAVLHVVAIILLMLTLRRIIRPDQFVLLVLFSILLFALPIGWENLLAGFQSQFYFLLIFSLLALIGFSRAPAWGPVWWGSVLCCLAAYFSMASGALTAAAAVAMLAAQMVCGHRTGRKEQLGLTVLVVMTVAMLAFIRSVPGHEMLKAHNFAEFGRAFLACLSFPRISPYSGLWINLPAAIYAVAVLLRRPSLRSPHWVVLGLIIWLLTQSISLSYGRAVLVTSPRYLDVIIVGLPVNFAILLFAQSWVSGDRKRGAAVLLTVGWLCIVVPALIWNMIISSIPAVIDKGMQGREQERNVMAYLRTGNLAELQGKAGQAIPYPVPERLAALLSDPVIRQVLPDALRSGDIDDRARLDHTWLKGRLRGASSRIKRQILSHAQVLAGVGVALAFAGGMLGWRRRRGQDAETRPADALPNEPVVERA